MASNTLALPDITGIVIAQYERLNLLKTLADLAINALPNSTDSDVPLALLTGMAEILTADICSLDVRLESIRGTTATTAPGGA